MPGGGGGEGVTIGSGHTPLDLSKTYTLATKEYLAQGKDGYDVLEVSDRLPLAEALCDCDHGRAGGGEVGCNGWGVSIFGMVLLGSRVVGMSLSDRAANAEGTGQSLTVHSQRCELAA